MISSVGSSARVQRFSSLSPSSPALTIGFIGIVLVTTTWIASYAMGTVRRAFSYYRENLRTFALIGAMLIPTGFVVAATQTALFAIPPVEPLLTMMQRFPGVRIFLTLVIGSVQLALAVIIVTPAVIVAMSQLREGTKPGVIESYRRGVRMIWQIFLTRFRLTYRIVREAITIVGIPRAIRRILGGLYVSQAVLLRSADSDIAIDDSFRATQSGLARTIVTYVVLTVIVLLTGPIIAIFVLLAIPSRPVGLINYISSILFSIMYPIAVIGMTLLYLDLRVDEPDQCPAEAVTEES